APQYATLRARRVGRVRRRGRRGRSRRGPRPHPARGAAGHRGLRPHRRAAPGAGVSARPQVRVRAPGKINLALRVGAPDEDGYPPLATVFQAVSLHEDVVVTPAADLRLTVEGRDAERVPLDGSNLALRAARLLQERTGITAGAHLHVVKQVPVAGGMGGGSADAAAALLACDQLWGAGL